jgi:translation elongation factor EF-Tu-like GTPase
LLLDARHGMKKADLDFLESLQAALYAKKGGTQQVSSLCCISLERINCQLNAHVLFRPTRQKLELPPIQIVLTKCDLVRQADLARRVVLVRQELSNSLTREPSHLPIMLVSARREGQGGVLELQKELAALVPTPK